MSKTALEEEWANLSQTADEFGWRIGQTAAWENDHLVLMITKGQYTFYVHYNDEREPELEKIELVRRFNNLTQIDMHMQQN